jgi:hypothetical protein
MVFGLKEAAAAFGKDGATSLANAAPTLGKESADALAAGLTGAADALANAAPTLGKGAADSLATGLTGAALIIAFAWVTVAGPSPPVEAAMAWIWKRLRAFFIRTKAAFMTSSSTGSRDNDARVDVVVPEEAPGHVSHEAPGHVPHEAPGHNRADASSFVHGATVDVVPPAWLTWNWGK